MRADERLFLDLIPKTTSVDGIDGVDCNEGLVQENDAAEATQQDSQQVDESEASIEKNKTDTLNNELAAIRGEPHKKTRTTLPSSTTTTKARKELLELETRDAQLSIERQRLQIEVLQLKKELLQAQLRKLNATSKEA